MVLVNDRINIARQALTTLEELLNLEDEVSDIVRDAAIQRFEYTFEAVWKAAKHYLKEFEGIDVGSPKGVIRASLQVGILDAEQAVLGLDMTDDRNRTVHTYNRELAVAIYNRLSDYAKLMSYWIEEMSKVLEKGIIK